jgi:broad specificity phosphatase PhoE
MVVHLIRHLKPGAAQRLDPPLEVAAVFSSPLDRARRTAEMFFPNRDVQYLPELAEIGMGEWEGLSWDEIEAHSPELAREKLRDWFAFTPPGGENWRDFETRVAAAWRQIRATAHSPCAVVAHAAVNFVLAQLAADRELTQPQGYGEVITLESRL